MFPGTTLVLDLRLGDNVAAEVSVQMSWDFPVLNRVCIQPLVTRKVKRVYDEAVATCPVGTGPTSGKMKNSIRMTIQAGDPPVGYVSVDDPAYVFVAGGTQEHEEVAVNAMNMAFVPKSGGGILFRKAVSHPATQANPFLFRALQKVVGGNAQ